MRRYAKPMTAISPQPSQPQQDTDDSSGASSFDVEELLNKGGLILRREIQNLLMESSRGKLAPASARDLVAYVKLLSEIKSDTQEELANMTDEELSKLKQNLESKA